MESLAPIILFVYNRPEHTRKTVEALAKNELAKDCVLYIFADGPKDDAQGDVLERIHIVRDYIHSISGFKDIIITEAPKNKGLANSVIDGVTEVIDKYGKAIMVEDDIVTHPLFLTFMNKSLDLYANNIEIFCIGGYNYPIRKPFCYHKDTYIVHRSETWGWATWKDRWIKADWEVSDYAVFIKDDNKIKLFNRGGNDLTRMLELQMDNKIDSWAIRWDYCMYKNNAYCLRPVKSLVRNIGCDGTGVHCNDTGGENVTSLWDKDYVPKLNLHIKENKKYSNSFFLFFLAEEKGNKISTFVHQCIVYLTHPIKIVNYYYSKKLSKLFTTLNVETAYIGNKDYGGYHINLKGLDRDSIVYSIGLGEDISFDLNLIEKTNCSIFAFDPTPKTIEFLKKQRIPKNFHFYPIGISDRDTTETWYFPLKEDHVSCSIYQNDFFYLGDKRTKSISVEVKKLRRMMSMNNHEHIDLLKMDIEGSEYKVIEDIIRDNLKIKQLTLEFHHRFLPDGNKKTYKTIKKLLRKGFVLIHVNNNNFEECTFLNISSFKQ